jgi:putative transposase
MVKPDIDSATDADWSAAAEREELIAPLASTPRARLSEVDEVANNLGLSRAMTYRLLARYRKNPQTSSLLPDHGGRKLGSFVLDDRVERIVARFIKTVFLTPERPSIAALHRLIFLECMKSGLPPPSYKAVRTRIQSLDPKELTRRRFGAKAARDRFRPVQGEGLRPIRPLDLFQIDHTPVDVIAVDEIDRLPIGRPWLTVVNENGRRISSVVRTAFLYVRCTRDLPRRSAERDVSSHSRSRCGMAGQWPADNRSSGQC